MYMCMHMCMYMYMHMYRTVVESTRGIDYS